MAGRKIIDEHDARRCLRRAAASGLLRAEWARAEGIDGRSLNMWRLNLDRHRSVEQPTLRLVELVPAAEPAAEVLTVRIGLYEVEVPMDFNAGLLEKLLGVLARC